MDPRHDPDLILGHLEGDLSPEDTEKVQALCAADPDFAALLDGMADDRARLRAAPLAPAPAGLADAALADLERSMLLDDDPDGLTATPIGRRRFAIAPLLTYGGIAAVLALTASAVLKSVQPPPPVPAITASPEVEEFDFAAAPIETQRALARRDQAQVTFDPDQDHAIAPAPPNTDISALTAKPPTTNAHAPRKARFTLDNLPRAKADTNAPPATALTATPAVTRLRAQPPADLSGSPPHMVVAHAHTDHANHSLALETNRPPAPPALTSADAPPHGAAIADAFGESHTNPTTQTENSAAHVPEASTSATATEAPTPPPAWLVFPMPKTPTAPTPPNEPGARPILGSDWTRWTSLPRTGPDTPRP